MYTIWIELDYSKSLLVMISYNSAKDLFELILVDLLSNEDKNKYKDFYNFIINNYEWNQKILTLHFGKANLKAIKEIFIDNKEIKIKPCFFPFITIFVAKSRCFKIKKKNLFKILNLWCLIWNLILLWNSKQQAIINLIL